MVHDRQSFGSVVAWNIEEGIRGPSDLVPLMLYSFNRIMGLHLSLFVVLGHFDPLLGFVVHFNDVLGGQLFVAWHGYLEQCTSQLLDLPDLIDDGVMEFGVAPLLGVNF